MESWKREARPGAWMQTYHECPRHSQRHTEIYCNFWIAARNNWNRTNVILKFSRACAGHCLVPTENSTTVLTTQNTTKNSDYTTIADRLRMVSWSNNSHQISKPTCQYRRIWKVHTRDTFNSQPGASQNCDGRRAGPATVCILLLTSGRLRPGPCVNVCWQTNNNSSIPALCDK